MNKWIDKQIKIKKLMLNNKNKEYQIIKINRFYKMKMEKNMKFH